MSVAADILRIWRDPGGFIAARLAEGVREDRALAVLMGACGLSFVAQWPGLARAAHLDPAVPLDARLGGALMATLFVLPILAYALAALAHLLARGLGGRGTFFGARLALFWAWLAAAPLALVLGLLAGLTGPSPVVSLAGLAIFAGFALLWGRMLWRTETGGAQWI